MNLIRSPLTASIKNRETGQRLHFLSEKRSTDAARTTGFLSLRRAGFSRSFLWTPARSPARARPWMVSALTGRGLGPPFWLPGISSLPLLWTSTSTCAPARAPSVWVSVRRRSRRGGGRKGGDGEAVRTGGDGTSVFAVIGLLKIVAFNALILFLFC